MSAIPKKRLCWNCEGRVAFSDENCPFCGVYLSSSSLINQYDENTTHIAPYRPVADKSIPASPYGIQKEDESEEIETESNESFQEEALNPHPKSALLPISLLLSGSIFLMFGLILLLFSRQGVLTLQWNASYWFVYLGAALVLLFSGWRSLRS